MDLYAGRYQQEGEEVRPLAHCKQRRDKQHHLSQRPSGGDDSKYVLVLGVPVYARRVQHLKHPGVCRRDDTHRKCVIHEKQKHKVTLSVLIGREDVNETEGNVHFL